MFRVLGFKIQDVGGFGCRVLSLRSKVQRLGFMGSSHISVRIQKQRRAILMTLDTNENDTTNRPNIPTHATPHILGGLWLRFLLPQEPR